MTTSTDFSLVLVEDDDDHAEIISSLLSMIDDSLDLRRFRNADILLSQLVRAEDADLVLLDINMPGLNGLDALGRLKSNSATRAIPVVVLTTSQNPPDHRKATDLNANGYVVKKTRFDEMRSDLDKLISFWRDCNLSARKLNRNVVA